MKTNRQPEIAVLGAGMIGLTTALLLARAGHRVTVLERDPAEAPSNLRTAWEDWPRRGVSQFHQPHLMLPRWTREMRRELPDLLGVLEAAGAARTNLLHLQPDRITQGRWPGDEEFDTITARRPMLEAALGRLAAREPGVLIRRGVRVTGLAGQAGDATPRVIGVHTEAGFVPADLVVDAGGRHTPVPGWVEQLTGTAPAEQRAECGFIYYSRHYRGDPGHLPEGRGPILTHHPALSLLTLPGDNSTWCVVVITSSRDRNLRRLRNTADWEAVVRANPISEPWIRSGVPSTGVTPIAGIQDVTRDYGDSDAPVITGLVAVGDSSAATNPSLGRGISIGTIQATVLRDVLARAAGDPDRITRDYLAATAERVTPWVRATLHFDRHRLAEMEADIAGQAYATDDPAWAMSTALMRGAAADPVLARASSRIGSLLATPQAALADPEVQRRLGAHLSGPRYDAASPSRADVLRTLEGVSMIVPA